MADRLVLQGMRFFAHHGDSAEERAAGAHYDVDVEIETDTSVAGRSDALDDTINYVTCYRAVRSLVQERQFHLLEALAESIAASMLEQPRALGVRVRVAKHPPLDGDFERFAVVVERRREAAR